MPRPDDPFWRFSLRIYRLPGVEQACLGLQEHCGADVNLLLFCGWTGSQGHMLGDAALRAAVVRVARWQSEVIAPLRLARRGLKRQLDDAQIGGIAATLRGRILDLELELERIEQAMLSAMHLHGGEPPARLNPVRAIDANLTAYIALLGQTAGPQERAHLACIAAACGPDPSAPPQIHRSAGPPDGR